MRLCKDRRIEREAAEVFVREDEVQMPRPMMLSKRSSSLIKIPADPETTLADAVSVLGTHDCILGGESPDMLVDLDSFVEAVAGVLYDDGITRDQLLHFEVDTQSTTR